MTKDNVPAPTPEERRSSLILSHSWNTVLNNDAKLFTLPPPAASDSNPTTESSRTSTSPLSREKSRKLSRKDIMTPRGITKRAVTHSTQRNALKSRSDP
eukprot:CAMPEP_0201588558 /NCGR_PEP_ID=MMETSP0190_2-20130828/156490_1 /ASSEMBLY_ACC=CAM_ASM_000263 /TAXON_ID=37353 /ORGANISM="Rosalina sp." /LENGTH=98 /DNA_ID=CAMNT_0048040973 /DNA_START=365 /DNA_END=658 /DNA_ORIENTATION=+